MEAFAVLTGGAPDPRYRALAHRRWAAATDIEPLDELLGGGLHGPGVTTLEADRPAQALAVAHTIARGAPYPVLVACPDPATALAWIVAGLIDAPAAAIVDDSLDLDEYGAMCEASSELADGQLEFTDTSRLGDLEHAIHDHARVVVLLDPERFGPVGDVVEHLIAVAARTDVAVLVVGAVDDLSPQAEATVTRIVMSGTSHTSAFLVRTDLDAMLQTAEVHTDCFRAIAH